MLHQALWGCNKFHNPQYIFDGGQKNPTTSIFLPSSGDIEKNVRTQLVISC